MQGIAGMGVEEHLALPMQVQEEVQLEVQVLHLDSTLATGDVSGMSSTPLWNDGDHHRQQESQQPEKYNISVGNSGG